MPENVRRRTLVQGAAWSVPTVAIAGAAPAMASSVDCMAKKGAIDWDMDVKTTTYSRTSNTLATAKFDPDGAGTDKPVTVTVTSTKGSNIAYGPQVQNSTSIGYDQYGRAYYKASGLPALNNRQLFTSSGTVGGSNDQGLALHQSPIDDAKKSNTLNDPANCSTTTFKFDKAVSNLTFTIMDIDSQYQDFWDTVAVTSTSTYTVKRSSVLTGTGTPADPWRPTGNNLPYDDTSTSGNVTITFTQPVSQFSLVYCNYTSLSNLGIDGDQGIYISDFTFTYNAC